MKRTNRTRNLAVTLTELLVVLVIISIIATIAMPVYINQSERAKFATAQMEARELARAVEMVGITHGRYVPLQVLDNVPGSQSDYSFSGADTIQNEGGNVYAINFNAPARQLNTGTAYFPLTVNSTDPQTARMVREWEGPFINFQRYYNPNPNSSSPSDARRDYPLDPWGNPYVLYSPLGIVGSYTQGTLEPYNSTGIPSTVDPRVDRWAVVSYGPDGISDTAGSSFGYSDDIVYVFGAARTETSLNLVP